MTDGAHSVPSGDNKRINWPGKSSKVVHSTHSMDFVKTLVLDDWTVGRSENPKMDF